MTSSPALPARRLLALDGYWLAVTTLWAALGISLVPLLVAQFVCGGDQLCAHPRAVVGGLVVGKGIAEALIVDAGLLVSILVQPTFGALSDYVSSRAGRRSPFIIVGTLLDLAFLAGLYLAGSWVGVFAFYLLLQFSSNMAQGPFQALLPDLVPPQQVGLASGLMGLMIMLGTGLGPLLVLAAAAGGDARAALFAIGAIELVTMALTVKVPDRTRPRDRRHRPWIALAREAWGRDVLRERSYVWLLGSRLVLLMTGATFTSVGYFYATDSFGLAQSDALAFTALAGLLVVASGGLSTVPAAVLAARRGRKATIYAAAAVGMVGMGIAAVAPTPWIALVAVIPIGAGAGAFLAVDWALLTSVIPSAASGRFLGLSNVVTCTAGVIAAALSLTVTDIGNGSLGHGAGPRLALLGAATCYVLGSALLVPVCEPGADMSAELALP